MIDKPTTIYFDTAREMFYGYCENSQNSDNLPNLEKNILSLPEPIRDNFLWRGFSIAVEHGNIEALKTLLFHPTLKIKCGAAEIFNGLIFGLDSGNLSTLQYLIEAPLPFKNNPANYHDYLNECHEALYYTCQRPQKNNSDCIKFLIEHIHEYSLDKNGITDNMVELRQGRALQLSWGNNNINAIKILIELYNLTGEEKEIKKALNSDVYIDLADRETITTMLQANKEKRMLEFTIGVVGKLEDTVRSPDDIAGKGLNKIAPKRHKI